MQFDRRKILYTLHTAIFMLSAFGVSKAQTKLEAAAIFKAKKTLVSRIEKGMPRQPFAIWFRKLTGSRTSLAWETNDCGEQTGDPAADKGRDFPLCVEAVARQSAERLISVNVQYGTFKKGVTRMKPVVRYISIGAEGEEGDYIESLSDLQKRLTQLPHEAGISDLTERQLKKPEK